MQVGSNTSPAKVSKLFPGKARDLAPQIAEIIKGDDASAVFAIVPLLASVPPGKYCFYRTQLKEHFKRRLSVSDLNRAVQEAREEIAQERPQGERPSVVVNNRQLDALRNDTLSILYESNTPPSLFQRSGELVRIIGGDSPRIEAIDRIALRGILANRASFYVLKQGEYIDTLPPLDVCDDILKLPSWDFPVLEGITRVPILRQDGTVLDAQGYDSASRLYFLPNDTYHPVSLTPGPQELAQAREIIEDIIGDFPFERTADKANYIGLMITPLIRSYIKGQVPMHGISAPRQGAAKTLMGALTNAIARGSDLAPFPETDDEEEMRKRAMSMLLDGGDIIMIDNIMRVVESPSLNALLTSPVLRDRVLGTQKTLELRNTITLIITGNNLKVGTDTQRRYVPIRVDPQCERPWERTGFKHPELMNYVLYTPGVRARVVWALFTFVRSWLALGSPAPQCKPLGSFENWARTIGGVVESAGYPDFLGNLGGTSAQVDEELLSWEYFLNAWYSVYGSSPVTSKELVADITNSESDLPNILNLRDAIPTYLEDVIFNPNKKGDAKKMLGNALSKRRDQMAGGYKLSQARNEEGQIIRKHGAVMYTVTPVQAIAQEPAPAPGQELAQEPAVQEYPSNVRILPNGAREEIF